ncbi:MAG: hypothetical protein LBU74_03295 [Methanobacteriaceae archaeon]|jgi:hypothetical protein|nr:hypothetical protein [Candidatus Methanorudis spinitermitis]
MLKKVQSTRVILEKTFNYYKSAVAQYTDLHELSLKELMDEAIKEQDNNINWKNQKLNKD